MKAKKYWIVAAIVTCVSVFLSMNVLGISLWEKSQLKTFGISTLKGLNGVFVFVSFTSSDESVQVTKDTLQTKVELELRKAGIKVFSDFAAIASDPNVGTLLIACTLYKVEGLPMYNGNLTVSLHQYVKLIRNPKILTTAMTWPNYPYPYGFSAGERVLEERINNTLTDGMNEFINDYLAANPKEQPAKKQNKKPKD